MKAKVTSHDLIDEIKMNEEKLIIRIPQGKFTIKADSEATTIEYRAIGENSTVIGCTPNILNFTTIELPAEFKIALLSRKE